jgi:aryl-alcohol dehydrogenase-like predicted oxidoreductase
VKTRTLGRTGIEVSEIGFGAWGLGATMWRGVADDDAIAAVRAAVDAGVTFIDTALAYGDGHSERLIAKARTGAVVATKIPPLGGGWPAAPDSKIADVFPARYVRTSTETSLRNLGGDAIALQQFHVWQDAWLEQPEWTATRREMEKLVAEGKVLHWGISINDHAPETALRALGDPLFESAQVIYNIFDRSPEKALFDLARAKNLGIIVRVPFDEGALTGKIRPDTRFPEGDWRHRYFRGDRPAQAARRADALLPLLGDEAKTLPELALRFILSRPEVSTVIPGMRTAEHARANAVASDGRLLESALLEKLKGHAWVKNWYDG